MIRVKNGYLLDLHPPTEYNYQWQSTPSPVPRGVVQPVMREPEESEPIALDFTTGSCIYITTSSANLPFTETSISFFSRATPTAVQHTLSSMLDGSTYRLTRDGGYTTWATRSLDPMALVLMTDRAAINGADSYAYNARLFIKYRQDDGYHIVEAPTYRTTDIGNWVAQQQMMLATQTIQQQEHMYTVSGGVVPNGG